MRIFLFCKKWFSICHWKFSNTTIFLSKGEDGKYFLKYYGSWIWGTIQKESLILLLIVYVIFIEHQHNRFLHMYLEWVLTYVYTHVVTTKSRYRTFQKVPLCLLWSSSLLPRPLPHNPCPQATIDVFVTKDYVPSFLEFHVNEIMQYVFFCVWLFFCLA